MGMEHREYGFNLHFRSNIWNDSKEYPCCFMIIFNGDKVVIRPRGECISLRNNIYSLLFKGLAKDIKKTEVGTRIFKNIMNSYLEDLHKCYENEAVFKEQVKLFIATETIWQPLAPVVGKVYNIIKEALLVSLSEEIHNNSQKEVLLNACKRILADMDVVTDSNVYLYSYAKIFIDDSNNVTGIEFENTERVDIINGMVFEIISSSH